LRYFCRGPRQAGGARRKKEFKEGKKKSFSGGRERAKTAGESRPRPKESRTGGGPISKKSDRKQARAKKYGVNCPPFLFGKDKKDGGGEKKKNPCRLRGFAGKSEPLKVPCHKGGKEQDEGKKGGDV